MTHVTCRLTAKNRDQLQDYTLGNRVWATFTCRVPELIRVLGSQPAGDVSHKPGGKKGKVFPYSLPSVGPGADPGVQAVSPQVT